MHAALVTPLSGPLATYGRAASTALSLWAQRSGFPEPMRLTCYDAHPDAESAMREAQRSRPDLLFGPYGSGPLRRAAAASSRLVFNHGGAAIPASGLPNVVSVLAPADTYFDGPLRLLSDREPRVRRVRIVHGTTGFGRRVASGAAETARNLGYDLQRTVLPNEPSPGDLLLVAGSFEQDVSAVRRLLARRWAAVGCVAAGVEEFRDSLDTAEGLLGPAQWTPELAFAPTEGPPAREFVREYRSRVGADPPYPAAQAFAAGVIAARCIRDAQSTDDAAVHDAAYRLDCTTLFGPFRLDPCGGRQIGHRTVTVQWQGGVRRVVWPPEQAQAPLRYPLGG